MGICVYCQKDAGPDRHNVCIDCIPHDIEVGKENAYKLWRQKIIDAAKENKVTEREFIIALKLIGFPGKTSLQDFFAWQDADYFLQRTIIDEKIIT